jgi:hypothetical protein
MFAKKRDLLLEKPDRKVGLDRHSTTDAVIKEYDKPVRWWSDRVDAGGESLDERPPSREPHASRQ